MGAVLGLDLWPPPDREEVVKSVYHADRLPLTLSLEGHAWGGWISTGQVSVGELERGGGPRVQKKRGEPSLRIKRRVSHLDGRAVDAFA